MCPLFQFANDSVLDSFVLVCVYILSGKLRSGLNVFLREQRFLLANFPWKSNVSLNVSSLSDCRGMQEAVVGAEMKVLGFWWLILAFYSLLSWWTCLDSHTWACRQLFWMSFTCRLFSGQWNDWFQWFQTLFEIVLPGSQAATIFFQKA